ncbi:Oidioi.mRNA.OKI2018_I69.chr2.g4580.t1.cds [Oikopleura dioica]|uniref:Oidioi.mRNA.OKI2018_I69.chr2.g4580.t1.cds n=1 Tax=Oikopleura dioica TaxID=34765 RepID=A0ABN7T225_OIKDI|nr:Oidioi.mRNA.OKI2018_I69.chr2.g4580.t1.cds [Oikopleura dioica]
MRPIFLPDTDAKSCFNLLRQNTNDFLGKLVGFDIDDFQRSGGSHNPMFYLHGTLVFQTVVKHKGFRKKIPVFITEGAIGGNKKTTTNRAYARMLNKMVRLMKNLELENFDPTPENDPTLEIGMTEIVPALPAAGEKDEEEDEPKLTKKEWMALMNKSSESSEPKAKEAKKIEESPKVPIIEAAMTEMGDSDLYSDIIEAYPDDFTLLRDDFPPLTPITKPTAQKNANKPIPAQESPTKPKTPELASQAKEEKSDREKALEDKIDRLENLVLKLLEDKTKSKKKSKKRKEESSSSEASSEDSDL